MTQLINENGNGANGLTCQWTYETNTLRLSTLQAGTNASFDNLQKLTYNYDNGGNVTNLVDTVNSSQKQCFQYDWLDRLTGAFTGDASCATYSATGTGPYNHSYAYDSLGNITSNAGNSYTYGDANHKHAVTAAFGNSYGHDANGNQTTRTISGVTYTFTYDYENHLTAVSGSSVTASFVYDANGNRVKGTVNGTTTIYIAGLYEYQGGATTLYYEGNALRRTGYATNNGVFYLLRDQLQSSSVMINQNGTVNSRNYYYPFGGNRGGASFSGLTTKRFTGQYHEQGLPGGEGLSYYGARWYDAQLGRFTNADVIVPAAGNPQSLNRYSYVFNNPLKLIDPSGHDPIGCDSCEARRDRMHGDGGGNEGCMVGSCPSASGTSGFRLPNIAVNPGNKWFSPSSSDALNWTIAHSNLIYNKAAKYGVSPVLVSGLITAEIDLDNTWFGIAGDNFARTAYQHVNSPVRTALNDASGVWIATVTDTSGSMGDRISGYANVHHETYVIVEQYMSNQYGQVSPYGGNKKNYLSYLLTNEGTIDFTARMGRMLADLRKGNTNAHTADLTTDDMAVIWGAWRSGINGVTCFGGPGGCGYPDLPYYQSTSPGPQAQLGRPFFEFFGGYLNK